MDRDFFVNTGMFSTPLDIITMALKASSVVGVGQTPSAEDANDAFNILNLMIAVWNRKRWLMWAEDDVSCLSDGGTSYTIGAGQQFDTPRPDRLQFAFVRQWPVVGNQPYDSVLNIIDSHEDYARITLKNLSTWPTNVFYDSQFPFGSLHFYPVPPSGMFELHVLIKNQITPFTGLTQNLDDDVPPEFFDAILWNLAVRIRPLYGLAPDPSIIALAKISLNTIRQANMQVPTLTMPYGYPVGRRNGYGWTTGVTGGFA